MRVELDIPEYDPEHGLRLPVVFGAVIEAVRQPSELVIRANEAGLRLIAGQLLAMAQNGVPAGTHLHFDAGSGLEDGSAAFIVERTDRTV